MTIYTDWKVIARQPFKGGTNAGMTQTLGIPDSGFDLTPRVRGLTMVSEIEYGEVGSRELELVLDNSDGAFTPGGGGTYDAGGLDWFSNWLIWVVPYADTTDGTTKVGSVGSLIPTDVEFEDDGFNSIVTVYARDFSVWMERTKLANVNLVALETPDAVQQLIEDYVPPLGADDISCTAIAPAGVTVVVGDITLQFPDGISPLEVLQQIIMVEFGVLFPMELFYTAIPTLTFLEVVVNLSTPKNLMPFTTPTIDALRFTDPASIAAGRLSKVGTVYDLLPYRELTFGVDLRRNATTAFLASSTESALASDATGLSTYGARTIGLTEMPVATAPGGTSQQYLDDQADMLTNWWSASETNVEGLEISGGMIQSYCEDDALDKVRQLMLKGGFWFLTLIDITGAGGAVTQAQGTFLRSTLYVTPTDWVIRLEKGLGSQVGFGFRLDDDELGVLDENKLAAPTKIY